MKHIYILILILLTVSACEEKKLEPTSPSLGKPGIITEVEIEETHGGAIVSYRIPNSEDILGVKAIYTLSDGRKHEESSSFYDNSIEIVGFNDVEEHHADIYVFNKAQVLSDPVSIRFTPKESALSRVVKSVEIVSDFGGAQFRWVNEFKAPLNLEFLAADSIDQMITRRIIATQADTMRQSIRGFEPISRKFAIILSDQWNNYSDTIYPAGDKTVTPLFEEKLPKSEMSIMKLANDGNYANFEGLDHYLIDDDVTTFGHSPSSSLPAPFSIDLGLTAKLSRIMINQRFFSSQYYNWGNPKEIEVYVRADKPSQNGNWDEWTQVIKGAIVKPSGLPLGTMSDEDLTNGNEGHEFAFPLETPPMRYVRVRIISTWSGTTFTHPAEVSLYGEIEVAK